MINCVIEGTTDDGIAMIVNLKDSLLPLCYYHHGFISIPQRTVAAHLAQQQYKYYREALQKKRLISRGLYWLSGQLKKLAKFTE